MHLQVRTPGITNVRFWAVRGGGPRFAQPPAGAHRPHAPCAQAPRCFASARAQRPRKQRSQTLNGGHCSAGRVLRLVRERISSGISYKIPYKNLFSSAGRPKDSFVALKSGVFSKVKMRTKVLKHQKVSFSEPKQWKFMYFLENYMILRATKISYETLYKDS